MRSLYNAKICEDSSNDNGEVTNFFIMESCYHFYTHQWPHFIKNLSVPENGYVTVPDCHGLGIEFREEPFKNGDAIVETIAEI